MTYFVATWDTMAELSNTCLELCIIDTRDYGGYVIGIGQRGSCIIVTRNHGKCIIATKNNASVSLALGTMANVS